MQDGRILQEGILKGQFWKGLFEESLFRFEAFELIALKEHF